MPRNVSGIYTVPVGTDGVANTTIFSAKYNTYIHDVESDLNTPRPIVAGGTGASDATSALVALGGEKALQQVTNYDTFAFVPGSFWSAVGATSAPTSTARYVGYCVVDGDGTGDTTIVAWPPGTSSNAQYQRKKTGGAWTAWIQVASALSDTDLLYVKKGGDTMTGTLYIAPPSGSAYLNLAAPAALTGQAMINMADNGVGKWQVGKQTDNSFLISDSVAGISKLVIGSGTGPGTGVNLNGGAGAINLSSTGGITLSGGANTINGPTQFGQPLAVTAGGINVQFGGSSPIGFYTDSANAAIRAPTASGIVYMQNNGGTNTYGRFSPNGMSVDVGNFTCVGDVSAGSGNVNTGVFRFGNNGMNYIHCDGTNYNFSGNLNLNVDRVTFVDNANYALSINGYNGTNSYIMTVPTGGFPFYFYTTYVPGSYARYYMQVYTVSFFIDNAGGAYKPGGGTWADSSDSRIKDIVGPYQSGLAEIEALKPTVFTYKGNDTHEEPKDGSAGDQKAKAYTGAAPYPNSPHYTFAQSKQKFIGLIAQECETVMPELVKQIHGFIDGVESTDVRHLDPSALTFALVNAVKELSARVKALEGA